MEGKFPTAFGIATKYNRCEPLKDSTLKKIANLSPTFLLKLSMLLLTLLTRSTEQEICVLRRLPAC